MTVKTRLTKAQAALDAHTGASTPGTVRFRVVFDDAPEPIGYREDDSAPFGVAWPIFADGLDRYGQRIVDFAIGGLGIGDL